LLNYPQGDREDEKGEGAIDQEDEEDGFGEMRVAILLLIILPLIQVCGDWGNLLAEKQETFEIKGSFNLRNITVDLKLNVELLFRVWGQRTMDPGKNYTIAVEVVRKSSFVEVEGVRFKIGGTNPAFSYKFVPVTIAYLVKSEIGLSSYLRINASGRVFTMDHEDGEVILIPVRGSEREVRIIPEYALNGSFSGAVLTEEFKLVNVEMGKERGEEIVVEFSGSSPGYQNISHPSEGIEAQGSPNIVAGAVIIGIIVILIIILLYLRP
jgi:hypothetical protein